jgi:hypothetical protein
MGFAGAIALSMHAIKPNFRREPAKVWRPELFAGHNIGLNQHLTRWIPARPHAQLKFSRR